MKLVKNALKDLPNVCQTYRVYSFVENVLNVFYLAFYCGVLMGVMTNWARRGQTKNQISLENMAPANKKNATVISEV